MTDTETKAVILIKELSDNVPHPIFFGSKTQCKGILFDCLLPSSNRRNLVNNDADWGYWVSYERLKRGNWEKVDLFLLNLPEEGKRDNTGDIWFTL